MRTAGETAQTARARLRDILCGITPRSAEEIAGADSVIAAASLTAINTATFGNFAAGRAGNDVCAITSGLLVLTSADNPWVAGDVGSVIHVAGAGAAGGTLVTRIAAFGNAGSITLADAASTTVAPTTTSAAGLAIWGVPLNDVSASNVLPTGNATYESVADATGSTGVSNLTDTTLTLDFTYDKKILRGNNASTQAVTLHKTATVGFALLVEQVGAGQVVFAAQLGATLRNRQSQYGSAGQYAVMTLYVGANADGLSAIWTLGGDTA